MFRKTYRSARTKCSPNIGNTNLVLIEHLMLQHIAHSPTSRQEYENGTAWDITYPKYRLAKMYNEIDGWRTIQNDICLKSAKKQGNGDINNYPNIELMTAMSYCAQMAYCCLMLVSLLA